MLDQIAHEELGVWRHVATGRVKTQRIMVAGSPPPTPNPAIEGDGARNCCIARPGFVHMFDAEPYCHDCATRAINAKPRRWPDRSVAIRVP